MASTPASAARARAALLRSARRWLTRGSGAHAGAARLSGRYQGVFGSNIDLVVASLLAGGCATAAMKV